MDSQVRRSRGLGSGLVLVTLVTLAPSSAATRGVLQGAAWNCGADEYTP